MQAASDEAFERALKRIQRHDRGLEAALDYAKAHPAILAPGADDDQPVHLGAAQKRHLRQVYAAVLDHLRALDQIKNHWQQVAGHQLLGNQKVYARAYLISYAAWLTQYQRGLEWMGLTVPNKALETILDEAVPTQGINEGSFARLKFNIIHVESVGELVAGYRYYQLLDDELEAGGCLDQPACKRAMQQVDYDYHQAQLSLVAQGWLFFGYNAFDILRDATFDAWFPVQKSAARWMGDTRLVPEHAHLITPAQIREMGEHLKPGDIMVSRSNWYLSNAGLPGFWPHALLYIGTPDELRERFEHPDVRRYYQKHTDYDGLIELLKAQYPSAWRAYTQPDSDRLARRVLEARSEGVIFNSLQQALAADYAAAMRPNTSRLAAARAIQTAFSHWNKPYDFNFDFLTDRTLVCTELVYKAWRPTATKKGIPLELVEVMGRSTLPANGLVRQFDQGYNTSNRDLEFVYFLDGREHQNTAVVADLAAFRASWRRPKWGFLQR